MLQPDMTSFLTDGLVPQIFQGADEAISRYVSPQPHAASTGISSSLT